MNVFVVVVVVVEYGWSLYLTFDVGVGECFLLLQRWHYYWIPDAFSGLGVANNFSSSVVFYELLLLLLVPELVYSMVSEIENTSLDVVLLRDYGYLLHSEVEGVHLLCLEDVDFGPESY